MSQENKVPNVEDEYVQKPCIVTFMDVLGSSDLLMRGTDDQKQQYLRNLDNMFQTAGRFYDDDQIKTFSDNILIHDDDSDEALVNMIDSVAQMQYLSVCVLGLFIRGGMATGGLYRSNHDSDFDDFTIGDSVVKAHAIESSLAKFPRVLVQKELAERYNTMELEDNMLLFDGKCYYIDYLQATLVEGFLEEQGLEEHRRALVDRIAWDNANIKLEQWDSVRVKDVWCLAYHNDFCRRYGAERSRIDFTEEFDNKDSRMKIVIRGENE